jgi:hypothetical protein
MNKKFAKSALMGAVVAAISVSFSASAQSIEDMSVVSSAEVEVKMNEVSAQSVTDKSETKETEKNAQSSIGVESVESSYEKDFSQVSKLDALTVKASEGDLELRILEQSLERKKLESQLKEDEFQERLDRAMAALTAQFQERESQYAETIASLKSQLKREKMNAASAMASADNALRESSKTENSVFVTNVVGVGNNLTASVYFEDKIIDVREGMRISPSLSVLEITPNGVVFKDGEDESFVALTNEEYAFSKTFNKEAAQLMRSSMSQQNRSFR